MKSVGATVERGIDISRARRIVGFWIVEELSKVRRGARNSEDWLFLETSS